MEAAAASIPDGATLALGGMTLYRRPLAFVKALLRRDPRPRDLTLLCFTGGLESDLLIGAGCVRAIRSAYVGLEAFGFAPMFTRFAQEQRIQVIEETEASLVMGIRAQITGAGFLPSRAWVGTDLPRLRPDVQSIRDPYSGELMTAFPAITCDVAVLHGLAGDEAGNVQLNNNLGVDMELVYLADTVIATVERLEAALQRNTDGPIIPNPGCDMLVHAAGGAAPSSCYPRYFLDGEAFLHYSDCCQAGRFEQYLQDFLHCP